MGSGGDNTNPDQVDPSHMGEHIDPRTKANQLPLIVPPGTKSVPEFQLHQVPQGSRTFRTGVQSWVSIPNTQLNKLQNGRKTRYDRITLIIELNPSPSTKQCKPTTNPTPQRRTATMGPTTPPSPPSTRKSDQSFHNTSTHGKKVCK